jgi:peptidoglycan/LPS O-acetylase OafA/YrhL
MSRDSLSLRRSVDWVGRSLQPYFSYKSAGGSKGLSPVELGYPLVALSVEEVFYLFFPLVCRVFSRVSLLLVPLSIFVVLGPFARSHAFNQNPVWREYSYLGGMDAIALGCLTALFCARADLSRALLWACGVVGTVLLVFSLGFSDLAYRWGLGRNGLDMTILAMGACMVVVAFAQTGWQAPNVIRPLVRMGRLSTRFT